MELQQRRERSGPKCEYPGPKRRRTVGLSPEADDLLTAEAERMRLSRSETVETLVRDELPRTGGGT